MADIIRDTSFNYQLLDRLRMDCEYYLGAGRGYEKHLWAGNVEAQIEKMKELHTSFNDSEKPEWLSWNDILEYEKKMSALKMVKEHEIDGFELDKGYLHFSLMVEDYRLNGLYRISDPSNGSEKSLVSIDSGYLHPSVMEKWDEIEKAVTAYAEAFYKEECEKDERILERNPSDNQNSDIQNRVIPRRRGGR